MAEEPVTESAQQQEQLMMREKSSEPDCPESDRSVLVERVRRLSNAKVVDLLDVLEEGKFVGKHLAPDDEDVCSPCSPTLLDRSTSSSASLLHTTAEAQKSERKVRTANLEWDHPPRTILIVKKPRDQAVQKCFKTLLAHMLGTYPELTICVQPGVLKGNKKDLALQELFKKVSTWREGESANSIDIDLVISLGGDGTLLHITGLFPNIVPPVLSFSLGSLGFLTPFDFETHETTIRKVLDGANPVSLRMRLKCKIINPIKKGVPESKQEVTIHHVMNEIVADRGPSPFLTQLLITINGIALTTVQGDGLIVATPTGSTAYSLAAGGSMMHPSIPAILLTPVCPHSLSFRPIVVPASVNVEISVPASSRSPAWVSMDGRTRTKLEIGGKVVITTSHCPVPTINRSDQMQDWFVALDRCLHWNSRSQQKHFDDHSPSKPQTEGEETD